MSLLFILLLSLLGFTFLLMLRAISRGKGRGLPGPFGHLLPVNRAFLEMLFFPKEYRTLHRYVRTFLFRYDLGVCLSLLRTRHRFIVFLEFYV